MLKSQFYKDAFSKLAPSIYKKLKKSNTVENDLRNAFYEQFKNATKEVNLKDIGAKSINGQSRGSMDIVTADHIGIELKVIRMPRIGSATMNALYYVGQLSADYARISHAKKLEGGQLLILVHGSLLSDLKNSTSIIREFHNRLFVDYKTSIEYGELHTQKINADRKVQIRAIKAMGFHKPFYKKNKHTICVYSERTKLALIAINVIKDV